MNFDEEDNGIYLTSLSDVKKECNTKNNVDNEVIVEYEAYHFDGPHLLYKEYCLGTVDPGEGSQATNKRSSPTPVDRLSYDESRNMEDLSPLPREDSIKEEYLLSMPSKKDKSDESHSNNPKSKPRKPVVQDIYDDDHYCLARTSGFGPHDNMRTVDEEQTENEVSTSSDKRFTFSCIKCKIIGLIVGILILGAIGGLLFFFLPTNPGKIYEIHECSL